MKKRIYALLFILLSSGLLAGCAGTSTIGSPRPPHAVSATDAETIRHAKAAYRHGDYTTALHEAMPLARLGNASGQFLVGFMTLMGDGIKRNPAEGIKWLRQSANQGNDLAQLTLGNVYTAGMGVAKDDAQAVAWFRKAADQGDAEAQFYLGNMYGSGLGVPRDDVRAYKWWMLAKVRSHANDQVHALSLHKMTASASGMTAAQIARARQEAAAWLAAHKSVR